MKQLMKIDGLTEMQSRFVQHYVALGDIDRAAALAGYSDRAGAYYALKNPDVQRAIKEETFRFLYHEAFPNALHFLHDLSRDTEVEIKVRADAAKFLIKATHDFQKLHDSHAPGASLKPLDQMTPDELRQHLERLQSELANRAKPVIDAPLTRQSDGN